MLSTLLTSKKPGEDECIFVFLDKAFLGRCQRGWRMAVHWAGVTSIQVKYKMKTLRVLPLPLLCSTNVHPNPWHHNKRLWFITLILHCIFSMYEGWCVHWAHLSQKVGGCPLQSHWFSSFLKLHNAYETTATMVNSKIFIIFKYLKSIQKKNSMPSFLETWTHYFM